MNSVPPSTLESLKDKSALSAVLTVRSDLRFEVGLEAGHQYIAVEDPVRQKFFRVGEPEYEVIVLLDGQRTGQQVVDQLVASGIELAQAQVRVEQVAEWLIQQNLAVSDKQDNAARLNLQAQRLDRSKKLAWLNPISIRIPLFNPNNLLDRLAVLGSVLFSTWFFVGWLLIVAMAAVVAVGRWAEFSGSMRGILSGSGWIWLLALWLVLKIVHELAHGLACKRYGGEVPQAGVLLLLFTPLAFVDVTSMWRFQNRWRRMVVSAAGMYVELLIAAVAILVWANSTGQVADFSFQLALMASVTTLLFNANPLMRFDGYFLLSDLIAIPNLYQRGSNWLSAACSKLLLGKPARAGSRNHETWSVKVYGLLAFVWRILICVGLILGASVLFQGAGFLLSLIGALFWIGLPVWKHCKRIATDVSAGVVSWKRLSFVGSVAIAMLFGLFYIISAPGTRSAPALVKFADQRTLRAEADGFVDEVLVASGQLVHAGQPLIRLSNPEIENEAFELEKKLAESKIQARIYLNQREHALAQAESENVKQLQRQLEEKRQQVNGLTLVSPADGIVFDRNLKHRPGQFVNCGDALLEFADSHRKQLVAFVDQRDFDERYWQSGTNVRALFPGHRVTQCVTSSIHPRATIQRAVNRV